MVPERPHILTGLSGIQFYTENNQRHGYHPIDIATYRTQRIHAGTLQRLLAGRAFFRDTSVARLNEAAAHSCLIDLPPETTLMIEGDTSPFAWFLIKGNLSLSQQGQPGRELNFQDPDIGYPIANLRPSRFHVVTIEQTQLLRMEQAFLKRLTKDPHPARFLGGNQQGSGSWQNHPFAIEVLRKQRNNALVIPPLPGISARIAKALQDPDCALDDIGRLISADPAIVGGLLHIANSVVFRGAAPCESLQSAIVRLGIDKTRTLVLTLAAKGLFSAQRPWIRQRLHQMWRHAVEIGAYCAVLARQTPKLDEAKGLLLGLLHEIGSVAVLDLADKFPELEQTPGIVDAVLANMVPIISSTTLAQWGLGDDIENAVPQQENWYYDHEGGPDAADLLIIAHLHGLIKARRFVDLPRIDETPAFARIGASKLSPRASLLVLDEAQQELAELSALLA